MLFFVVSPIHIKGQECSSILQFTCSGLSLNFFFFIKDNGSLLNFNAFSFGELLMEVDYEPWV